ncbi:MAG TPA: NAD(P)H-dependent glycerol-3-phosphate dehydrogenase, partial [Myxococcota bacterium]|nr:NAD(P)H-dependent glycerol-3-phosphate dehydrogenase [Myxococcota bacterium]
EGDTLMTMDEVAMDVLGAAWQPNIVALSGPSFAREIMQEQPTAVVLACIDENLALNISRAVFCDYFRAYCSTDVIGVEMGGALKNVMAIAAGALAGMGMGDNARAAMITRGVAEISRLAVAKGGNPLTLLGLAGVGDLVLTCTGGLSRNRAVGQALGEGKSVDVAVSGVRQVAEGVRTAAAAYRLAQKLGVDAPITSAVYRVLYEELPMRDAVLELVRRAPGRELE